MMDVSEATMVMLSVVRNVCNVSWFSVCQESSVQSFTTWKNPITELLIVFFLCGQGGLAPGGFNFDAKLWVPSVILYFHLSQTMYDIIVFHCWLHLCCCIDYRRRESTDVEDLFIAHIGGMDTLARGLRNVAKLLEVVSSFLTFSCHFNFSIICSTSCWNLLIMFTGDVLKKDGSLTELVRKRYESFDTEIGAQIEVSYSDYFTIFDFFPVI